MAIQVPRIQVNQQESVDQAPRIQSPGLDVTTPVAKQTASLENVASQAIKYRNEVADQQADTIATNARNDYLLWRKKRIYGDPESGWAGYANMSGQDPQEMYKQFDKEQNDYLDGLSKAPEGQDWGTETQTVVNRRLSKAYEESQLETLTQYSHQKKRWDDNNSETTVQLAQNGMFSASNFIKPGDDTSFGLIDAKIAAIRNERIAQGLRNGGAILSDDGDVPYTTPKGEKAFAKLTPAVKQQIQEDTAKGLSDTMMNLIQSKDLDKASAMQDKYSDYIDGYNKGKVNQAFQKAEVEDHAWDLTKTLENKSPDQIEKALKDEDPEVAHKVYQYIDDNKRHVENMKKRQQSTFYENLFQQVEKYKQQNPDATHTEIEQQPFWQKQIDKVSPTQEKALVDHIQPPKYSDDDAIEKASAILAGNDPEHPDVSKMTPSEIAAVTSRLGTKDVGGRLRKQLLDASLPSNSQKNQQFQHGMQAVKTSLMNSGLVSPDNQGGTDVQKGGTEAQKLAQYQTEFNDRVSKMGSLTYEQLNKEAAKFAQEKLQNRPGLFHSWKFWGNSGDQPNQPATPAQTGGLSQVQIRGKAIKELTQSLGRPPNQKEIDDLVKSKPLTYWSRK